MFAAADRAFPQMLDLTEAGLSIPIDSRPLTRMVARCFDTYAQTSAKHSSAV
jgi:oxygen-independent coproporphyrinogen III oxidase